MSEASTLSTVMSASLRCACGLRSALRRALTATFAACSGVAPRLVHVDRRHRGEVADRARHHRPLPDRVADGRDRRLRRALGLLLEADAEHAPVVAAGDQVVGGDGGARPDGAAVVQLPERLAGDAERVGEPVLDQVDPLEHLHVPEHERVDVGESQITRLEAAVDRLAHELGDPDVDAPRDMVGLPGGDRCDRPAHPAASRQTTWWLWARRPVTPCASARPAPPRSVRTAASTPERPATTPGRPASQPPVGASEPRSKASGPPAPSSRAKRSAWWANGAESSTWSGASSQPAVASASANASLSARAARQVAVEPVRVGRAWRRRRRGRPAGRAARRSARRRGRARTRRPSAAHARASRSGVAVSGEDATVVGVDPVEPVASGSGRRPRPARGRRARSRAAEPAGRRSRSRPGRADAAAAGRRRRSRPRVPGPATPCSARRRSSASRARWRCARRRSRRRARRRPRPSTRP